MIIFISDIVQNLRIVLKVYVYSHNYLLYNTTKRVKIQDNKFISKLFTKKLRGGILFVIKQYGRHD